MDASLNRLGEGLRLLEDIARFILNDSSLTEQLKNMRHDLLTSDLPFQQQLLQARDSAGDVGTFLSGEEKKRELPALVVANSRRVQEALRVMEELAKEAGLDSDRFKQARFTTYELEPVLLSRLLRQDKLKSLPGLYVILDTEALKGRRHIEAARQAIRGGATAIQLRDKLLSKRELLPIARQLKSLCAEQNALFIINDHLDLALAADADGLHLGQEDLPLREARKLLAMDRLLGGSARTVDEAKSAEADGADYVAVGSIYPTTSKEEAVVVGLERLRQVRQAVSLPLVAIGGISAANAAGVIAAGASSVAVISAVLHADDIEAAAGEIAGKLEAQA